MNIYIILAIAAIATALLVWKFTRKAKLRSIEDRVYAITDKTQTAGGVGLWIEKGAVCSMPETFAIEAGLEQCFEKARRVGYDRPLNLSDYKVAIIADSIRSPEAQIWSYKLPAGPYAGTEWDLGGYILAWCSAEEFERTKVHGVGQGHPLFWELYTSLPFLLFWFCFCTFSWFLFLFFWTIFQNNIGHFIQHNRRLFFIAHAVSSL